MSIRTIRATMDQDEAILLADVIAHLSKSGSLREREEKRQQLEEQLEKVELQVGELVEKHSESFYRALRSFVDMTEHIDSAKAKAVAVREALTASRTMLTVQQKQIDRLWGESQEQKHLIQILDSIAELKQVPAQVDQFLQRRSYVHAALLLSSSLRKLQDFRDVVALQDFRVQLESRRQTLHLELLEELMNIVFLRDKSTREQFDYMDDFIGLLQNSSDAEKRDNLVDRILNVPEPSEGDPKKDVKQCLAFIVQALAVLGRVTDVINLVGAHLRTELSILKDRALSVVRRDLVEHMPKSPAYRTILTQNKEDNVALSPHVFFHAISQVLLQFRRVLRAHACLLALSNRQNSKTTTAANSTPKYELKQLWLAIQTEISVLLATYLDIGDESHSLILSCVAQGERPPKTALLTSSSGTAAFQMEDVAAHFIHKAKEREKDKPMEPLFAFANSLNAIRDTEALAERRLANDDDKDRGTAPGDNYTTARGVHEQLSCSRHVANILAAFKPIFRFCQDTEDVMHFTAMKSGLMLFVDSYMRVRFFAHLQDAVRRQFQSVTGDAGFSIEEAHYEATPGKLIGQLLAVLHDVPAFLNEIARTMHDEILLKYLKFCQLRFRVLTKAPVGASKTSKGDAVVAMDWAVHPRIRQRLTSSEAWIKVYGEPEGLVATDDEDWLILGFGEEPVDQTVARAAKQAADEANTIIKVLGDQMLEKGDIVAEVANIRSMGQLAESLTWLLDYVKGVIVALNDKPHTLPELWGKGVSPILKADNNTATRMLERNKLAQVTSKLQATVADLETMCHNSILFLKLDVRARCLHFLLPVLKFTSYYCEADAVETDPRIIDLNRNLLAVEEALYGVLSEARAALVLEGLDSFVASVLIHGLRWIKRYNDHGIKRMKRNIFAIQQYFASSKMSHTIVLTRAMQYYDLLFLTERDIIASILNGAATFTEDQYRVIFNLLHANAKVPNAREHQEFLEHLHAALHRVV
ncbi:uncharacterized protein MONBRDRAFT_23410 [Monosiga brevicollis MX1]|uniref:Exocyst complex component Sec8 n=1 Tax=Monosiga brevicollis TaxID=81824 RepID=A9UTB4_MONBE|nr:uncharacterized protein MONBRDRAFT_23410 [Monosiga brevicollis MX1]EDQ91464.1 predicted protein [Monosiga brevicollis MX1]|eukprot:XP_001743886.1 hypothetical protein [Monosiga brevicollis MX1]